MLPLVILVLLIVVGAILNLKERAFDPRGAGQNLRMELAASLEEGITILGPADDDRGKNNRKVVKLLQYLDFIFIPLYVAFFISTAVTFSYPATILIAAVAILAGILDYLEDFAILAIANGRDASAKRYGVLKWMFYFASVALQALIVTHPTPNAALLWIARITAVILVVSGLWGIGAAVRRRRETITKAVALSTLGLLGLGAYSALTFLF